MSVRRQLLALLADGQLHSGAALGGSLGISRMAVWKHIHTLHGWGVPLEVVRGHGYRLAGPVELLDAQIILDAVRAETRAQLAGVEICLETDSTNTRLREQALAGAPSGTVCLAELQRAGRGRCNRPWFSPFAANLYLSLLWRSGSGVAELGGLSLAIGVAVVRSLRAFGVETAGLKWPNDVLVGPDKLAGILIEVAGESSGPCAVIIGIGINVSMPESAAARIDQRWTDLRRLTGLEDFPRNRLAAGVLDSLLEALQDFADSGLQCFREEWRTLDVIAGRNVSLQLPAATVQGRACGIDSAGALLLETPGGRRRFASGEVSLRVMS